MASGRPPQPDRSWEDIVNIVRSLYPDLLNCTYSVPPAHFNKVPYVRRTVTGTGLSAAVIDSSFGPPKHDAPPDSQPALPPSPQSMFHQRFQTPVRVRESDFRDDFAQNHVMHNLKALGDKHSEVMVILSRLHFGNYLNQPVYAAAALQFPLPSDLNTPKITYSDREPDLVLIHREHGILVGEIKSVGKQQAEVPDHNGISKRIKKAIEQLNMSAKVVRYLVKDVAPNLAVRKALFMPYISSAQLKQVLLADSNLEDTTCTSLGAVNVDEAVQLSCCSDQLSNPDTYWDVNSNVLQQLTTWWQCRMTCTVVSSLNNNIYTNIVARFVGPASTVDVQCNVSPRVEVRTKGQLVAELGWRLAQLILTLEQLDLMNRDPKLVCITGPPGTGKTVVLVLQAVRWILQGRDVHVVSTRCASWAVSILIQRQISMTSKKNFRKDEQQPGKVILHIYNFKNQTEDVARAVRELSAATGRDGRLSIILDEAVFDERTKQGPLHENLVTQLLDAVPKLCFWTACITYQGIPEQLHTAVFSTPLRCAPVVVRELESAMCKFNVHKYSDNAIPSPADGPGVIRLSHQGRYHLGPWPDECTQCGCDVARELRLLGVGAKGTNLNYRDVFILTRSSELRDNVTDDTGNIRSAASGIILSLRLAGLPIHVLERQRERKEWRRLEPDLEDMALAKINRIIVAHGGEVTGLERKIVVTLQGRYRGADDKFCNEDIDSSDKMIAVSRCTTQLITVTVPTSDRPESMANTATYSRAQSHDSVFDPKTMSCEQF